jgi:alkyl sulfatase BDS1-like metallo-beta-lactamase superfamily hydrolase
VAAVAGTVAPLSGCHDGSDAPQLAASGDDGSGHGAPTEATARANAAVLEELPFADEQDFEDARRGFLAARKEAAIRTDDGRQVWNTDDFRFLDGPAPDSVHPSLWRQARLNAIHGLFEVTEGIYQVRGYDLANMTLIRGDTGWIIIDPLTTIETAAAAMELVREHLGDRPVTGVIYTHSHIDHFGGARGVLSDADIEHGVPVVAPQGFVREAVSENVLAGNAMSRRAVYMFGFVLPPSVRGHVDCGLGKASTPGTFSLVIPNDIITATGQERTIDGVRMVFQNTPGAEAPAEMMIWLPDAKALCSAEDVTRTLHNLYTLRGAKVRDALAWSDYIDEALGLFPQAEILFASHHWPTWGSERIRQYLTGQRDLYKYIHDQTLRLANGGATPREIAEQIELPPALARTFGNRGYYGTVSHNAKAVYQHYFGWFDGNPANLHPLPPAQSASRYVEFMGGAEAVLDKARASYEAGDYRWAAEVLNHLVFADAANDVARSLLADTYDQLGYQAESGPWRDFYLTGARELRLGTQKPPFDATSGAIDVVAAMPTDLFFDALAVRLNGPKAFDSQVVLNFVFTDIGETHVVDVHNAVLHHHRGEPREDADATVKLTRTTWNAIATEQTTMPAQILAGNVDIDGSRISLLSFFSWLDTPVTNFNIVTP